MTGLVGLLGVATSSGSTRSNAFVGVLAALTPLLVGMLAAVGYLYRHERERREAIEQLISPKKFDAYVALLNVFFDQFKVVNTGRPMDKRKVIEKMTDANKELMLYASDEVLHLYQDWQKKAREGRADLEQFGELIVAIRKDMGHPKTRVTSDETLRQMIVDWDQVKGQLGQQSSPPVTNL